jgi:hypothetical protein
METKVKSEGRILSEKILEGIRKAIHQLYLSEADHDGEVVIMKDGKVLKVKARDLI